MNNNSTNRSYYKNYTGDILKLIRFINDNDIFVDNDNMQIFADESNCEYATLYPSGYLCLEEKYEFVIDTGLYKAQGILYEDIELPEQKENTVYIVDNYVFDKIVGINGRKDFTTPVYPVISNNTNKCIGFNALRK